MKFEDIFKATDGYLFSVIGYVPLDLGTWEETKLRMDSNVKEFPTLLGIDKKIVKHLFISDSIRYKYMVALFIISTDIILPIPPVFILNNHSMDSWIKG